MNKLLCVFNTCGIRGCERMDLYVRHVESLLAQDFPNFDVVVSGACNTEACKRVLHHKLDDRVSYNWTNRKLTVGITFNQTVRTMERHFGPYAAHVYVDSGIDMGVDKNLLRDMYDRMDGIKTTVREPVGPYPEQIGPATYAAEIPKCAMVAARTDTDAGHEYAGLSKEHDGEWLVPLGKSCNLHCQAFHRSIFDAFGNVLPDVFVGDTTESVFSFLCAAVNRRFLILGKPDVHHEHSMDGPSSGHQRGGWANPALLALYPAYTDLAAICKEGHEYGFGYEECQHWCDHDPKKFDRDGNALDSRLLPFMKQHLYLQKHQLDYDEIKHVFEPGHSSIDSR